MAVMSLHAEKHAEMEMEMEREREGKSGMWRGKGNKGERSEG